MKTTIAKAAIALLVELVATGAHGQMYINEIYFDPPGSFDSTSEYIELRGAPSASLANYYLILLENENKADNSGDPGHIDHIFNLGNYSLGTNGFLTMRQKNTPYTGALAPATGATNLVNTSTGYYSAGWGDLPDSTIGASQESHSGLIENSGFTAMLIRNNGGPSRIPYLGQDLDQGNNGLDPIGSDVNGWRSNWSIVDSIGIHSEVGEAQYGRLYGNINFGPEASANIEPGATYVKTGFEIEHVARWGDSTGQTAADWNVSNLTDNAASGYTGGADYRQSGNPHPIGGVFAPNFVLESSHGIPYGTPMCRTLGATNFGGGAGVWTGIGGTTWSTASGLNNWKISSGATIEYANSTDVTFNDTATGTTASISTADVYPSSVLFNNSSKNFTITGTKGIAGTTGLVKRGTGTVTLDCVNTYSGATVVEAGTLELGLCAQAPVLTGAGGVDVQGGKLLLDYTTTAPDVLALLDPAFDTGWATGRIRNTTAGTTGLTLGWKNDTIAKQVTIMATYAGDADLNGTVNVADLTRLLNSYNRTGMAWADGDFNYDGQVNVADLTALLNKYNRTIGGSVAAGAGLSMGSSTVPEPCTIILLATGMLGLLACAGRKWN